MLELKNSPRMSHIPTLRPSCASIVAVISTYSVDIVGRYAYRGTAFLCCFRPSAHVWPFTLPPLLTFKTNYGLECVLIMFLIKVFFWFRTEFILHVDLRHFLCYRRLPLLPKLLYPALRGVLRKFIYNHCCIVNGILIIFNSFVLQERQCILFRAPPTYANEIYWSIFSFM